MLKSVREILDYGVSKKTRIYQEKSLDITKKRLKFINRRIEKLKKETKETLFWLQQCKNMLSRECATIRLVMKQVPRKSKEMCLAYWKTHE